MRLCEFSDDHGPALFSVEHAGFCGLYFDLICGPCFLDRASMLGPDRTPSWVAGSDPEKLHTLLGVEAAGPDGDIPDGAVYELPMGHAILVALTVESIRSEFARDYGRPMTAWEVRGAADTVFEDMAALA